MPDQETPINPLPEKTIPMTVDQKDQARYTQIWGNINEKEKENPSMSERQLKLLNSLVKHNIYAQSHAGLLYLKTGDQLVNRIARGIFKPESLNNPDKKSA